MRPLDHILNNQIIAIIRGAEPEEIINIVEALHAGGVRTLEITINSPDALSVIERVSSRFEEELLIGAGTVLDAETARSAILAGAKFIISPTLNIGVIRTTRRYGCVSIPGAFTPTEILNAYEAGGEIIKVFPAILGAAYFNEIRGPLSQIPLMPTGGVTLENIQAFKMAGAVAFGIGSALVDSKQSVTDDYLKQLSNRAKALVSAVS
jgi:2-dehydro-3-deoxyphosphogluconate aldolase / (4S)-4-hydroxy-2-oxoglutarate aldolase